MNTLRPALLSALLLGSWAALAPAQVMDDLNGMWTVKLDGQDVPGDALTESYNGIRMRILPDGKPVDLTRQGDVLTGQVTGSSTGFVPSLGGGGNANASSLEVRLTISGLETWQKDDDKLTGTWFGHQAVFTRDTRAKGPLEIDMSKGDRPWVRFMREQLIPKSAEDRETYHRFDKQAGGAWLKGTELGSKGYWIGKGWIKSQSAFDAIIGGYHGTLNTPRNVLSTKLSSLIQSNIRPDKQGELNLALSSLGMYFSTASGGALRLIVTKNRDSIVYYITDRRAHERTGLVVNATPTHKPLASSFGKWQNDAGEMTLADDEPYDRAVLELMVKSNTTSMNDVSRTGRSAFTDYFGIMAIEDQRGVMFSNDDLDWGRNMTEASFVISIIRSLSHGQTRKKPEYRQSPEKTISDEPLSGLRGSANGQLEPSRSIAPQSIRIAVAGQPVVLDDGDGTLYAEGTDPSQESLGYVDYDDGRYNLSWPTLVGQAQATFKDAGGQSHTRALSRFSTSLEDTLGQGQIEPKSVRVKATGSIDLVDDGEGYLYDEGANFDEADSRGWIDYDDGTLSIDWSTAVTPSAVTWKTTDGQAHTQQPKASSASSGLLDPLDATPGSVRFAAASGKALVDDGQGTLRYEGEGPSAPSRGRVDYASGSYSARWDGVPAQPVRVSFQVGGQTRTAPVEVAVAASGKLKAGKVTPGSVRIVAAGLPVIVDDGDGTLHDQGTDPQENYRGYLDYDGGTYQVNWSGQPFTGTGAQATYRSKGGEIVLGTANELAMQVVVDSWDGSGPTLRPGTPSYIDVLNGAENALEGGFRGGNDCQVGEMSTMESLTTAWLRAEQAAVIDRFEQLMAPFGYDVGTDNMFSAMTWTFYDNENFAQVTPAQGDAIVEAGLNVFRTIRKRSRDLEAYMLANGVTKSEEWAPRASGF